MIIVLEVLLITILTMIMITLIVDEKTHRRRTKHLVRLKGYWDGSDRRRVERHNVALDVDYRLNHKFRTSKSKDISTRGLGLILEEKLEKKSPLSVEIKINNLKAPIKAKARVVWSEEVIEDEKYSPKRLFHTGIKFVRFSDPSQEKKLFDYIRSLEEDTHRD